MVSCTFGIEILDAHAEAIEAEAAQGFQMRAVGDARIDFDADFSVGREGKLLGERAEKIFHLRGRQIGGRAAAPVKLHHRAFLGDASGDVLNFVLERREVGDGDAVVLLNDTLQAQNRHRLSQNGRCM